MINLDGLITKEDKEEEARLSHMRGIDRDRDEALNAGFEWNGMMFDSDDKSIQRINAIATLLLIDPDFETDYITKDNAIIHLNPPDIKELALAAADHESRHVFEARRLKDSLIASNNQTHQES